MLFLLSVKEVIYRTTKQEQIIEENIIFLKIKDIAKITGWCEVTTRALFAHDSTFPAIKVGKSYLVEYHAFIEWAKARHVNNDDI